MIQDLEEFDRVSGDSQNPMASEQYLCMYLSGPALGLDILATSYLDHSVDNGFQLPSFREHDVIQRSLVHVQRQEGVHRACGRGRC